VPIPPSSTAPGVKIGNKNGITDLSKLLLALSVDTYGAVGDGVTDDSSAIQLALNTGMSIQLTAGKTYLVMPGVLTFATSYQTIYLNGGTLKRQAQVYSSLNGTTSTSGGNTVIPVTATTGFAPGQFISLTTGGSINPPFVSQPGANYASAPALSFSSFTGSGAAATAVIEAGSGRLISSTGGGGTGYFGDVVTTVANGATGGVGGQFANPTLNSSEENSVYKILSVSAGVSITVQGVVPNTYTSGQYVYTCGTLILMSRTSNSIIGPGIIDGNTSNVTISRWQSTVEILGESASYVLRDVTFMNTPGDACQMSDSYGVTDHCTFINIGNNASHAFNSPVIPWSFTFLVSGVSVVPAVGDTYTVNGGTYIFVSANLNASGAGFLVFTSTAPPPITGTLSLVRATGSGTTPIAYTSVPQQTDAGHIVFSNCNAINCHLRPQNGHTTAAFTGSNNGQNVTHSKCFVYNTPFIGIGYFHTADDSDVTITDNVLYGCLTSGIQTIGSNLNTNPNRILAKGNRIKNCGNGAATFALYMGTNAIGTITQSPTQMSAIDNTIDCTDSQASGIWIQQVQNAQANDNNVYGSNVSTNSFGINVSGSNGGQVGTINGNTVAGFGTGIFFQGQPNTTCDGNAIENYHVYAINSGGSNGPNTVSNNTTRCFQAGAIGIRAGANTLVSTNHITLGTTTNYFIDVEGNNVTLLNNILVDSTGGQPSTGIFLTTSLTGTIIVGTIFRCTPATYINLNGNVVNVGVAGTMFVQTTDANNATTTLTTLYTNSIPSSMFTQVGQRIRANYTVVITGAAASTAEVTITLGGNTIFDTTALTSTLSSVLTLQVEIVCDTTTSLKVTVTPISGGGISLSTPVYTYLTGLTLTNALVLALTGQSGGGGAASNLITAKDGYASFFQPIG
jgi:hypothetical protein